LKKVQKTETAGNIMFSLHLTILLGGFYGLQRRRDGGGRGRGRSGRDKGRKA
jgi:hypothetical protein